jgi:hypothetical protein
VAQAIVPVQILTAALPEFCKVSWVGQAFLLVGFSIILVAQLRHQLIFVAKVSHSRQKGRSAGLFFPAC